MIDFITFIRYTERKGFEVPKEVSGLPLALILHQNPDKFFWRGDTCFVYDTVNETILYCKPFNKRHWWYLANGLNQDWLFYNLRSKQSQVMSKEIAELYERIENACKILDPFGVRGGALPFE